jgi:hypothetical protein
MRDFVKEMAQRAHAGLDDWFEIAAGSSEGIELEVHYEDVFVELPEELQVASKKLADYVPDEEYGLSSNVFNAGRYCLLSYNKDSLKGVDERNKCILYFCKSDYRNYLVTNGINLYWAKLSGLDSQYHSTKAWFERWHAENEHKPFFFNSFGIYMLITIRKEDGLYAVFRERSSSIAVNRNIIVATVDEGIRRRGKVNLFDEESDISASPNIMSAAYRACYEETGIDLSLPCFKTSIPKLLSVGFTKSLLQPGALFYLNLDIGYNEFEHACKISQDDKFEFSSTSLVKFERDCIIQFILESEKRKKPMSSSAIALALYALGKNAVKMKKIFLTHTSVDKPIVRRMGKMLEKQGFSTWIDEAEILLGDSLVDKISAAIHNDVDCLLFFVSKDSIKSSWVNKELSWALTREMSNGIRVIPVLIGKHGEYEVPDIVKDKLYADFRDKRKSRRSYETLYKTIRTL